MAIQQITPPLEPPSLVDGNVRKRVCKACDRCRLKKSKCDGSNPCGRCRADNAICVFGERKKSHDKVYPKGYVEMLENQQAQLVAGLQELYKRSQTGEGWIGSPLRDTSHGKPLTHDILERLGALKHDGHSVGEGFEEDLDVLQQRLIADGAGFMQRDTPSDSGSEDASSPPFDQPPLKRPSFTDPFALNRFPPTPPYQSPYLQTARTAGPSKSQTFPRARLDQIGMNPTLLQRQSWGPTPVDDNMDFVHRFDCPTNFEAASSPFSPMHVPVGTINPAMSVRFMEEDVMLYNPTLI